MNLAAVAQNLAAAGDDLAAEVSRPMAIHQPSPVVAGLIRAITGAMSEGTPPTDVLHALAVICAQRSRQWMTEGYVEGSWAYSDAASMIECLASDLQRDYIGQRV